MPGGWDNSWRSGSWSTAERGYGGSTIRASDAERAEVAELLSKHYTEGRLDKTELDERMDQAMKAKTRGELTVLLNDLPRAPQPQPQPSVPVPAQQSFPMLPLLLFPLFILALVTAAAPPHIPVLLLLVPFLFLWRRYRGWRHPRFGPRPGPDQSWPGRSRF